MFIGGVVKAKYSRMKRLVCKNIYSSLETFGSKLHVISCGKLDRSGVVLISKLEEQQKSLFGGLADTLAFIFPIKFVFNFIFSALYFTYITIPLLVLTYLWSVGIVVFCRRSEHARQFALHISAIYAIGIF